MIDDDEGELFEATLRRVCRSTSGVALDRALDDLGWREALSVAPRVAVSSLFGQLGAANATASALDAVVGSALDLKTEATRSVALPALGRWQPPGRMSGGTLAVDGVGTTALAQSVTTWVVAHSGDRTVATQVATSDLALREVKGVDQSLGLFEVTGTTVPVAAQRRLDPGSWPRAVALAQLALGHELVGCSRTMLELARAHALERIQFGQPIASFQAVRHRLADTLVAIEASDAALSSAWDEGSPQAAAGAKALAGRSARTSVRHCQQVLAGIGFTTEHDFHRYLRRALVLDQLFGTSRDLTRQLGRDLLATRHLPPLPPL